MTARPPGLPAVRPRSAPGSVAIGARVRFRAGPRRVVDDGERARPYWPLTPAPRPPRRRIDLRACRNILVVKLDYLGDWVLTTPFLASLRRSAPRARITVAVLQRAFELASGTPDADRVVAVEGGRFGRLRVGAARLADAAGFRADYEGGRFDLALIPRWDIDFNGALQLAYGSGAPVITYSERTTAGKRRLNRGDDRYLAWPVAEPVVRHDAEHNLRLLGAVGGTAAVTEAHLAVPRADARGAEAFLAAAGLAGRPFIAFSTRASAPRRSLTPARAAAVGRLLAERLGARILLVGGRADAAEAAAIAAAIGPAAVSSLGRVTMRQSLALTGRAALFVGVDSGPAHMAAALGVPVAVISCHHVGGSDGEATSPHRFAPLAPAGRVLVMQPAAPADPCRGTCRADRPHCILEVGDAQLLRELLPFAARFLPEPVTA